MSHAEEEHDGERRDFLYYATGGAGAVVAACRRLAAGQSNEPLGRRSGPVVDHGRRQQPGARHPADRQMARQAGLHPSPLAQKRLKPRALLT